MALLALHAVSVAGATPSEIPCVANGNYTLGFPDSDLQGSILIGDNEVLQIGSIDLDDGNGSSPDFKAVNTSQPGPDTVKVEYNNYSNATLWATYTCSTNKISIQYSLTVADIDDLEIGNTYFQCNPINQTTRKDDCIKGAHWEGNGPSCEASEVKEGYFREFINPDRTILLKFPENSHIDWGIRPNGINYEHIAFQMVKVEEGQKEYTSNIEIFILPQELQGLSEEAAAAATDERVAVLKISTTNNYNMFKPEERAPAFKVEVTNVQSQHLDGELTVTAHTLDGEVPVLNNQGVPNTNVPVILDGFTIREYQFTLPEAKRELYFVEASLKISGDTSGKEYFTRTNIAILPGFEFKHKKESVFGISAYFPVPDETHALELLDRLGVHHLRDGDNREIPTNINIHAFAQTYISLDEELKGDELRKILNDLVARKNDVWELGNELNYLCKTGEDPQSCVEKSKTAADKYGDQADLACWMWKGMGLDEKIAFITMGIAGQDLMFLDYLKANGSYNCFDGIAFHPGRAEYTADFDPDVDAPNAGDYGHQASWTYYGTVKGYMNYLNVDNKRAYATEVYAGTLPNFYYRDSYRQAAANIVLSLALGLAEGLSSIQVYQLNDGTWYDIGGINEKVSIEDTEEDINEAAEYHFGLLMRDLSLKPSAMAYAATAEVLDGAKLSKPFIKKGSLRALVFDIDENRKVTLLWDRSEGYVQNKPGFFHSEPWVQTYMRKVAYRCKTTGEGVNTVQVVDMIGRKSNVAAVGSHVHLKLNGEPIFVYDIDGECSREDASIFLLLLE
jgi:hypothetical protein